MVQFLIKRCFRALVIVLGVSIFIFMLANIAPTDPADLYRLSKRAPSMVADIHQQSGADSSFLNRYAAWFAGFFEGEFGYSPAHNQPVSRILAIFIPATVQLALPVFFIQLFAGLAIGILRVALKNSRLKQGLRILQLIFFAIPAFWLLISAVVWVLPDFDLQITGNFTAPPPDIGFLHRTEYLLLPALALSMPLIACTSLQVEKIYLHIMQQSFIHNAITMGLSKKKIYGKYVLKDSLFPLGAMLSAHVPLLLVGTILVETMFAWPGVGMMTFSAIPNKDYPVLLASILLMTLLIVIARLLVDICAAIFDPRIRLGHYAASG